MDQHSGRYPGHNRETGHEYRPELILILQTYAIHLSLLAFVTIAVASRLSAALVRLVPGLRAAEQLNRDTAGQRLQKQSYVDNMKMNRKWGLTFTSIIFGLILPFCLTLKTAPWWMYPVQSSRS